MGILVCALAVVNMKIAKLAVRIERKAVFDMGTPSSVAELIASLPAKAEVQVWFFRPRRCTMRVFGRVGKVGH